MEQENMIEIFGQEKVCEYKGRRYYVRDNGAVYRQCQKDGIIRKRDEEWTFGKRDSNTGYMFIGPERVHRIVCTAYHGAPVGERNVVNGNQKCSDFGNSECSIFGIKTTVLLASAVQ